MMMPRSARARAAASESATIGAMREFFRANPQVAVLLVICLLLGIGTFIAVVVALLQSGGGTPTGEPTGAIAAFTALLP